MNLQDFVYSLTNASPPTLDDTWFIVKVTFAPHHIKLEFRCTNAHIGVLHPEQLHRDVPLERERPLYAHVYNDKGVRLRDFIRASLSLHIDTIAEAMFHLDIESRIRLIQFERVDGIRTTSLATSPTFVTYAKQLEMRLVSVSSLLPSLRLFCH